jgi:effector-binding domain-containing protein
MLDPLTALGLASNVVQLITFTGDLVAKGRDIYQSTDGGLVENLELEAITKSLQDLSLEVALPPGIPLTKVERELQQLCDGCRKAADELLDVIQKLKAQGPHKRWVSFRQALNSVWKAEEIQALSIRLERYRRQIDTTLLLSLRETLQSLLTVSGKPYERASQRVLGSVDKSKQWQDDFINALQQQAWQVQGENDIGMFSSRLSAGAKEEREQFTRSRILERLQFTFMNGRYEKIEEAYKKTFDWILQENGDQTVATSVTASGEAPGDDRTDWEGHQNPRKIGKWDSFTQWLHSQQSLYWITGKPGSGKSTLMKYLYNDPRTLENLELWRKGNQFTMAGFFF